MKIKFWFVVTMLFPNLLFGNSSESDLNLSSSGVVGFSYGYLSAGFSIGFAPMVGTKVEYEYVDFSALAEDLRLKSHGIYLRQSVLFKSLNTRAGFAYRSLRDEDTYTSKQDNIRMTRADLDYFVQDFVFDISIGNHWKFISNQLTFGFDWLGVGTRVYEMKTDREVDFKSSEFDLEVADQNVKSRYSGVYLHLMKAYLGYRF